VTKRVYFFVTFTVTVTEWLNVPLVPVTVTVYVPTLVVDETFIDSIDEEDPPGATVGDDGLREALKPLGADAASETVPEKALTDVTFIVELPEAPVLIPKADGDAEIEKSGVVGGVNTAVRGLPRPVA
jgi:hypothetical protein